MYQQIFDFVGRSLSWFALFAAIAPSPLDPRTVSALEALLEEKPGSQ
jgi:hypothetical protein